MPQPPLWSVEGAGGRAHLFGDMVGVRPESSWFGDGLRAAVTGCRELWCEADRSEAQSSPAMLDAVVADEPLARRLDAPLHDRVQAAAGEVGIAADTLGPLRPWAVAQVLELGLRASAGLDGDDVSATILGLASAAGIPVHSELGGLEATLGWFTTMPREVEDQYLAWTLDRVDRGAEGLTEAAAAWLVGDLDPVADEVATMRASYPRLHDRLLVTRNRAWVGRFEALEDDGGAGTVFVFVGSAHLVGDDGLPRLLIAQGLRVEPVT